MCTCFINVQITDYVAQSGMYGKSANTNAAPEVMVRVLRECFLLHKHKLTKSTFCGGLLYST